MAINEEFQESGMTLEELQVQLTDIELSLAMEYFNIEHIEYEAEMEAINYYKDYNSNMSLVTGNLKLLKKELFLRLAKV